MCLTNPCQSDIWWLTTARRNSYQPVLVRIYRNSAILEAWLPFKARMASFHDVLNMYPQNVTVRLKFSVQDICPLCPVIARTTYMTVVNTPPPSPLR